MCDCPEQLTACRRAQLSPRRPTSATSPHHDIHPDNHRDHDDNQLAQVGVRAHIVKPRASTHAYHCTPPEISTLPPAPRRLIATSATSLAIICVSALPLGAHMHTQLSVMCSAIARHPRAGGDRHRRCAAYLRHHGAMQRRGMLVAHMHPTRMAGRARPIAACVTSYHGTLIAV